ncbi:MAG: hypothetical protein WCK21_00390 [Actinomycetota bacterium]
MSVVRVQKRQLEKAKQEKAAAKRERRHSRDTTGEVPSETEAQPQFAQDEVLAQLAELHRLFGDDQVPLDEFESQRELLLSRLRVD